MAYTLWKFGSIELPTYNRSTKMTPVRPRTALVATAAGVFDAWGSGRAQAKFPHTISLQCTLVAEDVATWRSSIDALRAAVGTRATLVRRAEDDGAVQKCEARLVDCQYSQVGRLARHQQLTLTFEQLNHWRGKRWEDWELDDGYLLDDGLYLDVGAILVTPPGTVQFTVGGNLPSLDVRITVTFDGVDTDPAYIVIPETDVALKIAGPWANLDSLVIDSAARSITLNGTDIYDRLNIDDGYAAYDHLANEWLVLEPGLCSVFVVGTAVDDGVITFTEAWA